MKTKAVLEGIEFAKSAIDAYEEENPFLTASTEITKKQAKKALKHAAKAVKENKKLRKEIEELKMKMSELEFEAEYPDGWTM